MIERRARGEYGMGLRPLFEQLLEGALVMPLQGQASPVANLAINLYEDGDNFVIEAQLPGMEPDDIDVTMDGDILTIHAQAIAEDERLDRNYICREHRRGSFTRSLRLPDTVDRSSIQAFYENGILRLVLPKSETNRGRRIPIAGATQYAPVDAERSGGGRSSEGGQTRFDRSADTRLHEAASERGTVRAGMMVFGADGEEIGRVKEVGADDFLVDRRFRRDIFIPFDAIRDIDGDRILIDVPSDKVDDMGWKHPEILPVGNDEEHRR